MGVLDQLPEGGLARELHELQELGAEIKAPQTIGSSGVLTKSIQSLATSDITIPANDARDVLLQFTPSDMSFGGSLAYRVYYSVNGGSYGEVNPSYRLRVGADGIQSWRIFGDNQFSATSKSMKFIIICIGSGTFTASLVS
ncbi:hypothetical protein J2X12_004324 [Pseudarthrobacter oxydans]|uniref:Uncharacterized protein n=1 Tax=Pseudarthrobacter oxydans TaxID=1671 RepID=A0AAW8NIQ4_PSEOX|nr:hypothetical protein [Pseudarthrobacter oxydans]MDR6794744.1 hypothetical protein [Pseudarthrobacter oxydans]MDR7166270.1 hypothetical protein [Pseudarthrobacter oxydans]